MSGGGQEIPDSMPPAWWERFIRLETKLDIVIGNHTKAITDLQSDVERLKTTKNIAWGAVAVSASAWLPLLLKMIGS